ncbi:(2Fe-2S)-binding protein [Rhizobium sp. BE258]|jgi:predicted molibdopterin-dependent oxidoreductase YjgC|uniref:(2Fe-2S)-binding protein n=1 Tax=Rhizobium sp. BE258 TaxID=2817722 RepID=UPI00285DDB0E|nr:(2Fe-2S)-binding protein [Rhizobium sp. BE258]MDR7145146.1 putative molibdopterin-dependent oxidoreductase YjgC [Rhizobium sp. BE258]
MLGEDRSGPMRLPIAKAEEITITVDGEAYAARLGETVLTALRMGPGHVRHFEFAAEKRAGFCLMGACQDCWLWQEDGQRLRACTTRAECGMRLATAAPEERSWK